MDDILAVRMGIHRVAQTTEDCIDNLDDLDKKVLQILGFTNCDRSLFELSSQEIKGDITNIKRKIRYLTFFLERDCSSKYLDTIIKTSIDHVHACYVVG